MDTGIPELDAIKENLGGGTPPIFWILLFLAFVIMGIIDIATTRKNDRLREYYNNLDRQWYNNFYKEGDIKKTYHYHCKNGHCHKY